MESKERLEDDFKEAEQAQKLLGKLSTQQLLSELARRTDVFGDYRIRSVSRDGKYRAVAPAVNLSRGTVYINNVIVIEAATQNALKETSWVAVGDRLTDKMSADPRELAIFRLLANSDR